MLRSMFSAISGLKNHQTMMDVVGNNIANVNTTGFKTSNVVFQDVLSQVLRGGGAPNETVGGTNASQVGLGAKVPSVTTNFAQGALQRTGRAADMAIQGDGFFAIMQNGQQLYTRAGSFSIDASGRLVTQEGGIIQGWQADVNGRINPNAAPTVLQIPVGSLISPSQTDTVQLGGNLPSTQSDVAPNNTVVTTVDIIDSQGNTVPLTLTYTKTTPPNAASSSWTLTATVPDPVSGAATPIAVTNGTITFDGTGERTAPAPPLNPSIAGAALVGAGYGNFAGAVTLGLGEPEEPGRVTGYADVNNIAVKTQNGTAAGSLQSFTLSQEGLLVGTYSNGRTQAIGQLAIATFTNPEGLEKVGGSNYRSGVNSGLAALGTAGAGGRGLLSSGTIEMSNVDLAAEFTNLIVAQRGFQANSRVITSSDEMLQDIVNLKR